MILHNSLVLEIIFYIVIWVASSGFTRNMNSVDNTQSHNFKAVASSKTIPVPTEKFDHQYQLDENGNFWLFWKVNGTNITFETHVMTRGYIGFGISPNGNMYPSDVIVGWVNSDGTVHFQDSHTIGRYAPVVDKSQDWYLLRGMENDFGTILTFTRQLDTCDDDDIIITNDTMIAIFSYHSEDPDGVQGMQWHGIEQRGAQSLKLLSVQTSHINIPTDAISIDLIANRFHVPNIDTCYQCSIHKLPALDNKNHMIRYEPLIQKDNLKHVHHMNIFSCPDASDDDVGRSYDCFKHASTNLLTCTEVIAAWAVGGNAFSLPEHVGYPIGDVPGRSTFLKLQIHYNNPTLKTNIIDSSGIRLILTPTLRTHDAGGMFVGVGIHDYQFIPPYEKEFTSSGQCSSECTSTALPADGIKIYALFQHAHLLGTSIATRHIRADTELPPIATDHHYAYSYQDVIVLHGEIEIKPGDSIITECKYDSTKKRNVTLGGLGVHGEMCTSLLYYYPKIAMSECFSDPIYGDVYKKPKEAVAQFFSWDWKDPNIRHRFQSIVNNSTHVSYCNVLKPFKYNMYYKKIPQPTMTYKKENRKRCQ